MQQYLDLLRDVRDNGVLRSDRTGTGTRSVFGRQVRFDLSKGFPMLTTKKMFTRGMIEELLWFISGSVDVRELQSKNVHFWDAWQREDGTIGPGYGVQMRDIRFIKEITPRLFTKPLELTSLTINETLLPDMESDSDSTKYSVGSRVSTLHNGDLVIIREKKDANNRAFWDVQFVDTGYITEATYNDLLTGKIKDAYRRSVHGVGYYGPLSNKEPYYKALASVWRDMIGRCYDPNDSTWPGYGGKGYFVCERWHCFSNFYKDAQNILICTPWIRIY
jgi:hypothetical protein